MDKLYPWDIPIELVLSRFEVEYFTCGSHEIQIKGIATLEHIQKLFNLLSGIEGVDKSIDPYSTKPKTKGELLERLEIYFKALTATNVPQDILDRNRAIIRDFLNGVFQSD